LKIHSTDAGLYVNLGNALKDSFMLDESMINYERAIHYNAECHDAYNGIGVVLRQRGQIEEPIRYFLKAIQLKPDFAEAFNNLGMAYEAKGLLDEAISCYQKAININPAQADIYNNIGNAFKNRDKIQEAESFYRLSLQKNPDNSYVHSNLVFVLNYSHSYDAGTIFAEHLMFAKKFEAPLLSKILPHKNERDASRRLRIGYVSPDFRRHSVNYFLAPLLASHDHERFEVFCYSDVTKMKPDKVTEMLKRYADHWQEIAELSDEQAAGLIRNDSIDILVDLAGHTGHNRMLLFARKPAPVQVSWLGYPNTTGLSSIDYRIVDGYTDPPGMTDPYYTEKLMRMPESFLCYSPAGESPAVGRLPAMTAGHITFGSFNILAKVSPITVELWSAILKKIPSAHLLMKSKSFADQATCEYTKDLFAGEGIAPKRIELLSQMPSYGDHLATYNRTDISLDTFPYNGTTTTCEALWMGVPVVTLAGDRHASRVGMSLLTNIGLPELVAQTEEEYIEIAVKLSEDMKKLQSLREKLRDMMTNSPLTNSERFTAELEDRYRTMWQTYCSS
jgi:protein O-GlcNAc transferase